MVDALSVFALKTVYVCINLLIFVPKHCKICHHKDWYHSIILLLVLTIIACSKTTQ